MTARRSLMMHQTDLQSSNNVQPVAKQQLEAAGFKVDMVDMDWQSVVSRRARKEPVAQGGWNIFFTTNIALDSNNPGAQQLSPRAPATRRGSAGRAIAEMEKLRDAFLHEPDPDKQKALGLAISDRVMDQGFFVPVGLYKAFGAYRKDRLEGWLPVAGPGGVEHQQEDEGLTSAPSPSYGGGYRWGNDRACIPDR